MKQPNGMRLDADLIAEVTFSISASLHQDSGSGENCLYEILGKISVEMLTMKAKKRQVNYGPGWFSLTKLKSMESVTGSWEIAAVRKSATIGRSCLIKMQRNSKQKYSAAGKLMEPTSLSSRLSKFHQNLRRARSDWPPWVAP
jgi:hypothetical protein